METQANIIPSEASIDATEDEPYDLAEPRADAMIQSLRSVGYDLSTAIADLVDNSIAAQCKNVWLEFYWNGANSHIAVVDDGFGMTEAELINAMRPGSRNPLDIRDSNDLGRFGLGLKTASFSQAKKLTVGTKQNNVVATRCWDLDFVTRCGAWRLLQKGSADFQQYALPKLQSLDSGTVVFWESMDRITAPGTDVNSLRSQDLYLARIDQIRNHIALVFHRFLNITSGRSLKIHVNGVPVKGWDPFLSSEKATQLLTEEAVSLFGDRLTVRPYVLPHHSKISQEKYKAAAGPKGWIAHQGFYIYRNRRLLVAGSWLGLGFQQEEHYKLARISVDIPNHMDAAWEIDIKKSRAWPPPAVRDDLRRLAVATRSRASEIYRHRGARLIQAGQELTFIWERKVRHSKIYYEINREHPIVKTALLVGGEQAAKVRTLLHLIEETVPIPTITHDAREDASKQAEPFEKSAPDDMRNALGNTYKMLLESGMSRKDVKLLLMNTEPFNRFREMVTAYDDETNED